MRSFRLLAIVVLALALALSSMQNAYAGQVGFGKVCIPNPTDAAEVKFRFALTDPTGTWNMDFRCDEGYAIIPVAGGTYVFTELVSENPPGWVFRDIACERLFGDGETSWEIEGASVTINHDPADVVVCYFTNVGPSSAVGGYVEPVNSFALLSPWLAVIGLVTCISTAVVVAKKRRA